MTVYVDDMYLYPIGQFRVGQRTMKMSHMIADTREELIDMARSIGLNTRHIQKPRTHGEHFDICLSYRERAVAAGAVPITLRQCSAMCVRRRETGVLGDPADAEAWRSSHATARSACQD
ncbi:DUF4031 domain-containing protein [Burkholderia mayonis]|uniref:DUF4031 domain-containing protein n=1 Tax=Burkholderia mayonis TaxID=1385591 RepID=A0A1B4G171_9BURK|nr:DUF4031 domain-containing protein [Burkholderia mayonis]AOJ09647.1 hypothetical protein WS71_20255 [Burkholderia mayonis]KVE52268.1 hypothetical protein WS71_10080 [Burkholderia mayonis]